MIYTPEAIGNPVEYLRADPALLEHIPTNDFEIISGADSDVLILPNKPGYSRVGPRKAFEVPVFEKLYWMRAATGQEIGDAAYNLVWCPSPNYLNTLSAALQLEPGKDVLKFVHARHDAIPAQTYVEHIANGEFPLSTGNRYFWHDRGLANGYCHALGALCMPPSVMHNFRSKCQQDIKLTQKSVSLRSTRRLMESMARLVDGETAIVSGPLLNPDTFGVSNFKREPDRNNNSLIDQAREHIAQLAVRIEALKN